MFPFHRAFSVLERIFRRDKRTQIPFSELFLRFQNILRNNTAAMELIADMGEKTGGEFVFDKKYLEDSVEKLTNLVRNNAYDLNYITKNKYLELYDVIEEQYQKLTLELSGKIAVPRTRHIFFLGEIEEGMEDVVGNKAYNISRIHKLPNTNVPPSFVVAIGAFRDYIAYNDPFDKITHLIDECVKGEKSVEAVSHAIRLIILGGEIPPDLRREILHAAGEISNGEPERNFFSVRSSAVGEDGDFSFAGIYDSFLNVEYGELLSMFKKVLASLYNPASLEYRMRMNLFPMEMAMPVLYQKMLHSRVAGVLYTLDPNAPEKTECVISGSWGLGKTVVEAQVSADTFRVSRSEPYSIVSQEIRPKTWMILPYEKGPPSPVPSHLQNIPCLKPEQIGRIVQSGLLLERYFKSPLDIEWSLDDKDRLWILQARPIRISRPPQIRGSDLREVLKEHPVLLRDRGVIAYRGVGIGRVWLFDDRADLNDFPNGAVLVARHAAPMLAKVLPKASAVITDIGSLTGHMATVAREFRVPAIVGTEVATHVLRPGQMVTVDAERNIVYEGRIEILFQHQVFGKAPFEWTREYQILKRLLRKISPLSLTNPNDPDFSPRGCKTFHDIMRFVHEKAFQELLKIGRNPKSLLRRGGRRLRAHIPLDLILIDMGGGISQSAGKDLYIEPEQITSAPMRAIWEGLSSRDTWSVQPVPVDLKGLMSSLTRTQSEGVMGNPLPNVNIGVVGPNYVHLSLALGYHFTAVESAMADSREGCFIAFRFAGGVTDIIRRSRRATLLANILERVGFKVETKGDLVVARAVQLTEEQTIENLRIIGKLIGFTRQLDVLLKADEDIDQYMKRFMDQIKEDKGGKDGKANSLYLG